MVLLFIAIIVLSIFAYYYFKDRVPTKANHYIYRIDNILKPYSAMQEIKQIKINARSQIKINYNTYLSHKDIKQDEQLYGFYIEFGNNADDYHYCSLWAYLYIYESINSLRNNIMTVRDDNRNKALDGLLESVKKYLVNADNNRDSYPAYISELIPIFNK